MNLLINLFDEFGRFGPLILFLSSIYFLWDKQNFFFYYIVGSFISSIFNLIIKGILQQPRPFEDINVFHLALTHGKRFIFKNGIPYDIFGMPSGHAQYCMFSTIFIFLVLQQYNVLFVYLIISFITFSQRIVYNHHTFLQILVGTIVGSLFGYIMYHLATEKIKGNIKEKPDDFGPI